MLTFLVPIGFAITVPTEGLVGRLTSPNLLGAIALAVALPLLPECSGGSASATTPARRRNASGASVRRRCVSAGFVLSISSMHRSFPKTSLVLIQQEATHPKANPQQTP